MKNCILILECKCVLFLKFFFKEKIFVKYSERYFFILIYVNIDGDFIISICI